MLPPALRHVDFRNYLLGSFVSNVGNSVQVWAIAWHLYQLTHSSFMVGLLGLVRVVPLMAFSLFGGVVADQADRRKVMMATQTGMASVSATLFAMSLAGSQSVAPLYVMVGLNAIARAFDGPSRQAMMVGMVPVADFPNAVNINGVAWRLSDVLGPVIAGALIASPGVFGISGLTACYALNFVSFAALFVAVWRLSPRPPVGGAESARTFGEVIERIKEGLRFVNGAPVVRSAMWIDFWATLLSGAEALLPAFAKTTLHLGAQGYGALAASTGVGALLAATGLTWRKPIERQGQTVVAMIGLYGLFTIALGFAPSLWVACLCLAGVGASDMISTALRQTIRQLETPDALRGRMNATSSLFHISGPQLGDFEAGLTASLWGERFAISLGGGLCLLVAAHWSRAKALVGYHRRHHDPERAP